MPSLPRQLWCKGEIALFQAKQHRIETQDGQCHDAHCASNPIAVDLQLPWFGCFLAIILRKGPRTAEVVQTPHATWRIHKCLEFVEGFVSVLQRTDFDAWDTSIFTYDNIRQGHCLLECPRWTHCSVTQLQNAFTRSIAIPPILRDAGLDLPRNVSLVPRIKRTLGLGLVDINLLGSKVCTCHTQGVQRPKHVRIVAKAHVLERPLNQRKPEARR